MRALKRTAATVAAIGLSAGLLAGCGSSGTDAASSAPADTTAAAPATTAPRAALTAAAYKTKVQAICTKLDMAEEDLGNTDVNSVSAAKAAFSKAADDANAAIAEVKAITPPADLQAAHNDLVSSSEDSIVLFQSLVTDLESGTTPSAATLKANARKAMALARTQEAAAAKLGLTKCFVNNDDADMDDNDGD